jgi:hypothetical protein
MKLINKYEYDESSESSHTIVTIMTPQLPRLRQALQFSNCYWQYLHGRLAGLALKMELACRLCCWMQNHGVDLLKLVYLSNGFKFHMMPLQLKFKLVTSDVHRAEAHII